MKLFSGEVPIEYGYLLLSFVGEPPDMEVALNARTTGLLATGCDGAIYVMTASRMGDVPISFEYTDSRPPIDDGWEEIVEASIANRTTSGSISTFEWGIDLQVAHVGAHRVRCSASGLDAATLSDGRFSDEPITDRYRLEMWPSKTKIGDRIIKTTSSFARQCQSKS